MTVSGHGSRRRINSCGGLLCTKSFSISLLLHCSPQVILARHFTAAMSDFSNPSLNQPGEALRLDGIVDDVHYLIASELLKSSPDAVRALGQSSKTMRQATLPFIYRHLVLKKASYFETTYEAFIERFRMAQDCEISKHVRCLTVKDDVPEEDLLLVLDRVAEFGALRKLK